MTQGLAPLLDAKGGVLPAGGTAAVASPVDASAWASSEAPAIEADPSRPVTRVPVRLKNGTVGTVPITQLDSPAIAEALTPAQWREHLETGEKSKSLWHAQIASAEGVARGFTGGQSDIAAKGLAGTVFGDAAERETARHLREEEAAHPVAAGVGEASGFLGGLALGGPEEAAASKAEQVAPELTAGVEAIRGEGSTSGLMQALHLAGEAPNAGASASRLIEQQTAKLLGERTGSRLAGKVLGGAAENALYSAESQLDEQVLGDQDLNGEKIASAAGYGALMGGGLAAGGEVAHTFGSLAKKGVFAASPALEKMAGEQAFRAAGPSLAIAKEAERAGGAAAIGRTMIERDVIPTEGSALERALTPDELVPRNKSALNQVGKEITEITDKADARVPLADVMSAFTAQIKDLESTAATKGMARSVREFQDDFMSQVAGDVMTGPSGSEASIPIQTLIRERRGLGDLAYKESKALDPKMRVQALRSIYGAWSDLETTALDKASAEIGGAEGQKLRALNKEYQQLKIVQKSLDNSAAASIRNRAVSPSDYLTGAAAAISHPAGIAGAAIGGFSALAHKFIRERGNSLAASYLDRLSQLGAIRKVIAGADSDTTRAVDAFMSGSKKGEHGTFSMPPYRGGALKSRFQEAVEDASEPPKSVDFQHAPGIGAAVRSTLMRVASFLQSKIPEPTTDRFSITPQLERKQYTPQDMQTFLRYYEAANHPGLLAHELAQGKVHPETVEAVQTVAPKLFAELQQKVMNAARDLKHPLSYDKKIQLGVLFGMPTHWSLDPGFVYAFQQAKAAPAPSAPQGAGQQKAKGRKTAKLNTSPYATTAEAVQGSKLT